MKLALVMRRRVSSELGTFTNPDARTRCPELWHGEEVL